MIVDYIGIAQNLKNALGDYSDRDKKETGISQEEAVAVMLEKYQIVKDIFSQADRKLKYPISKIILEGPDDQLKLTEKRKKPSSQRRLKWVGWGGGRWGVIRDGDPRPQIASLPG